MSKKKTKKGAGGGGETETADGSRRRIAVRGSKVRRKEEEGKMRDLRDTCVVLGANVIIK